MRRFPSIAETSEDLRPIIQQLSKERPDALRSIHALVEKFYSRVEDAIYAHAVPHDENGKEIGRASIYQIRAIFLTLHEMGFGDLDLILLGDMVAFRADEQPGMEPREGHAQEVFENYRHAAMDLISLLGISGPLYGETPVLRAAGLPTEK